LSCESPNINEAAIRNVSHIFRKAGGTLLLRRVPVPLKDRHFTRRHKKTANRRGAIDRSVNLTDFLQRAKQLGISHLIKKVKVRQVVAGFDKDGSPIMGLQHEIEGNSALEAAKHLTKVFGLKDLPRPEVKARRDFTAAVERVMQQAIAAGFNIPTEELRKKNRKAPETCLSDDRYGRRKLIHQ